MTLKEIASYYRDELVEGIGWVVVYKDGRSWKAMDVYPADGGYEEGYDLDRSDREALEQVTKLDPKAICLNGYYHSGFHEGSTLQEIADNIRYAYENRRHQLQGDFLGGLVSDEGVVISTMFPDILDRVDRNGTKYYHNDSCPKCGGLGKISYYSHVDSGVCWECGGSGQGRTTWKVYTPEYIAKMQAKQLAKDKERATETNRKYLEHLGVRADGKTWLPLGNTYEMREQLKEAGANYNNTLGWHFAEKPDGVECIEFDVMTVLEEVTVAGELNLKLDAWKTVKEFLEANKPASKSKHVGEVGKRIELAVTYRGAATYYTHYSYYGECHHIHRFETADGDVLVWKSTAIVDADEGQKLVLVGTVKEHSEYKGEPQTELTRCRIKEAKI